jgi:non-specific serine/threonine protein kinase
VALSGRERQVAVLIAHGRANREIAEELVITERTAEAHVTHVLAKLGLRSRAQVAIWVLEHGGFTASGLPGPPAPGH